jgi:hypothetical protein
VKGEKIIRRASPLFLLEGDVFRFIRENLMGLEMFSYQPFEKKGEKNSRENHMRMVQNGDVFGKWRRSPYRLRHLQAVCWKMGS